MRIFKNKRITLLLGVSFVLLAGMMLYVLIAHNSHMKHSHHVMTQSQQAVVKLRHYSELMEDSRLRTQLIFEFLSEKDTFAKDQLAQQFEFYGAHFSAIYSTVLELEHSDFEKRKLDEQQKIINGVMPKFRSLIEKSLFKGGSEEQAYHLFITSILPEQDKVIDIFKELIAHQQENIEGKVLETVQSQVLDSQTQNYRGALIILVTFFLAYLVIRRISDIENENEKVNRSLVKAQSDLQDKVKERTQELEFQTLALDKHALVSITDAKGDITYANDRFVDISGYQREELIGQNHRILKSGLHPPEYYQFIWETIGRGDVWQGEICNRAKDGSLYWVNSTITPFLDDDGRPYKYVSIRTDITYVKAVEKALSENQDRLNRAQNFANIGIWDWDIETGQLHWSERIAPLFGYAPGELETSYENFVNALHPEDRQAVLDAVQDCLDRDVPYEIEHRVLWPDGQERWLLEKGDVVRDENGKAKNMLGVVQDVHDRKLADLELYQFKTTLDQTNDSVFMFDQKTLSFIYVNRGALDQVGYSEEELLTMTPVDIKPDYEELEFRKLLAQAEKSETRSITFETSHEHKNGSLIPVEISLQYFEPEYGSPMFLAIVRDVTNRKYLEHKLGQQSELLNMLRESIIEIIATHNYEVISNSMIDNLMNLTDSSFGFAAEKTMSADAEELETLVCLSGESSKDRLQNKHCEYNDVLFEIYKWIDGNPELVGDTSGSCIDKSVLGLDDDIFESFIAVPVYYGETMTGLYGLAKFPEEDIEDIKNLLEPFSATYSAILHFNRMQQRDKENQAELIEAKEAAEEANKAKSDFLASMSHELRTPLNAIIGFSEISKKADDVPESIRKNATSVYKAGKHLLHLINEILDLAKIESGNLELNIETLTLSNIIGECVEYIKPLAQANDIQINVGKCNVAIKADYVRMKQVVLNLLSNAVKYNKPKGSVGISVNIIENVIAQLVVKDSGIGIKADEIDKVFEPFGRAENVEDVEGTGIGLVLTKSLIEGMGGKISVESDYQVGSTFYVGLPYSVEDQQLEAIQSDSQNIPDKVSVQSQSGVRDGILLVEDNEFNQDLVRQQLEISGYLADIAENGKIGVEAWKSGKYRLILTDINMPEMSGYEMTEEIRRLEGSQGGHIPIVAMTANAMQGAREKCLSHGMDDYITKPIEMESLQIVLNQWFDESIAVEAVVTDDDKAAPGTSDVEQVLFNPDVLTGLVGSDVQAIQRLLNIFKEDAPNTLKSLIWNISKQDFDEVSAAAHKLKSSTSAIGSDIMTDKLQYIEETAKKKDDRVFQESKSQLTEMFDRIVEKVDGFLATLSDVEGIEKETVAISNENLQGLKVLVVDDDDFILEQVKIYFDDLGIDNCHFENTATAAMSNMVQQQQPYDLVMTDLNMPNVDGITFMRFLSKVEYDGALMIVSGEDRRLLNSVVQLGKAHNLNIIGALQKPFNRIEVRQMLGQMQSTSAEVASVSGDRPLTEDEIKQGLSQGNLELYFQPKVAVGNMSVLSLEALARWRAEDGKVLGPHLFIPVAEQSELINDLTDQVFIKSVEQTAKWHELGFKYSVAINFSMSSLERISLPDTLSAICSDFKVSPENITIEITETSIINQEAVALDVITRLHLKGFRLSIDDFGTGYSSIEQLNKLPFSEIKIDRSFVDGASNSYSSRAILESSIAMGKKMGISIVSEGVENEQDFELLKELGTEYVQGYFFSKPMPADSVLKWVENWNNSAR